MDPRIIEEGRKSLGLPTHTASEQLASRNVVRLTSLTNPFMPKKARQPQTLVTLQLVRKGWLWIRKNTNGLELRFQWLLR